MPGPFTYVSTEITKIGDQIAEVRKKNKALDVACSTAIGAGTGGGMGLLFGTVLKNGPPTPDGSPKPAMPGMPTGGPLVFARNFAVLSGTMRGVSDYIRLYHRNGVEDVYCGVGAGFAGGAVFTVVTNIGQIGKPALQVGMPPPPANMQALVISAVQSGAIFAGFQFLAFKIGEQFNGGDSPKKEEEESKYLATFEMLAALELTKYQKNFKKGSLDDRCLPLLSDSALSEVRIPPGPRLLILNQVSAMKEQLSALKNMKKTDKKSCCNPAVGPLAMGFPVDVPAGYLGLTR